MKILYICSDLGIPVLGWKGASIHVRALVEAWSRAAHEVVLAAPLLNKSPWEQPASLHGQVFHIPPSDVIKEAAFEIKAYGEALQVESSSLPGEVRRILYNQELERRLIRKFDSHPPDVIYERASLYGTAGVALSQALGRPLVLELNAPLAGEQATYRGSGLGRLAAEAERWTLTRADAVVVVSEPLRDYVCSLGVPSPRVHVMPNGIDPLRFRPRSDSEADERSAVRRQWRLGEGPVLGFVGGLRPWHGVDSLPDILGPLVDEFPNIRLLVVGDGPRRQPLERALHAAGLLDEHVRWTGVLPQDQIPPLVRAFDLALAPYPNLDHHFYFSPLKIFEYMGCGVPVVAPSLGQIRELVPDGEAGRLYPAGDLAAASEACRALLRDRSWREACGARAAQLVHQQYTWDRNARQVLELARSPRTDVSDSLVQGTLP